MQRLDGEGLKGLDVSLFWKDRTGNQEKKNHINYLLVILCLDPLAKILGYAVCPLSVPNSDSW